MMLLASCFPHPSEYQVVLGQHQRLHDDGTEQYFNVTRIHVHPSYNGNTNLDGFANDVAVLELSGDVDLSHPQVSPIQLATLNTDFTGLSCEISGWGKLLGKYSLADENGPIGVEGDTGGPMVCDGKLAGIYSWVVSPCRTTFPSVFTRVSEYTEWINSQ
ncbi:hypothetical protein LOTGIDRAFT_172806 [Lottia gigantea]|uniref:Peptidase S1 domain-containing protein n=1 Tax=Lottia gigantea TaxID=225164 RepID=V4AUT4_LOTGI|nr:hypothetical protein LOTGIDRAFT_172806 [Lottia gigantea]ESP01073.1 hypothetical protein LOTGIDRAFT_172806 [Lottia gigantea]